MIMFRQSFTNTLKWERGRLFKAQLCLSKLFIIDNGTISHIYENKLVNNLFATIRPSHRDERNMG